MPTKKQRADNAAEEHGEAIQRLQELASDCDEPSQRVFGLYNRLSEKIVPYTLVASLTPHAQRAVVAAVASFSRIRTDFDRLQSSKWDLSQDALISAFGCPSLVSRDFLRQLADFARARKETSITWHVALDALRDAQAARHTPSAEFQRGLVRYRDWTPADVTAARTKLMSALSASTTTPKSNGNGEDLQPSRKRALSPVSLSPELCKVAKQSAAYNATTPEDLASPELPRNAPPTMTALSDLPEDDYENNYAPSLSSTDDLADDLAADGQIFEESADYKGTHTVKKTNSNLNFDGTRGEVSGGEETMSTVMPQEEDVLAEATISVVDRELRTADADSCQHDKVIKMTDSSKSVTVEPILITSSPVADASINPDTFLSTVRRLERCGVAGWLAHIDFDRVFDIALPGDCKHLRIPNHDSTFDWSRWSTNKYKHEGEWRRIYAAVYVANRRHWVLLVFSPDGCITEEYDSQYQATENLAEPAQHIAARLGWIKCYHSRVHTPQQRDVESCGVYAIACALHSAVSTSIPVSLNPTLWRFALRTLVSDQEATALPSLSISKPETAAGVQEWINHVHDTELVFSRLKETLVHEQRTLAAIVGCMNEGLEDLRQTILSAKKLCEKAGTLCICSHEQDSSAPRLAQAHSMYIAQIRAEERELEEVHKEMAGLDDRIARVGRVSEAIRSGTRPEMQRLRKVVGSLLANLAKEQESAQCILKQLEAIS